MTGFPYSLQTDPRPRLGLIVLQADETIEDDFRRLFSPDEVRLHISRIASGAKLNMDTIREMEADLPSAAALFPASVAFDTVGYACTSGTTLIGADHVCSLVKSACNTRSVTDPLTATFAAIASLELKRIGIVSPYVSSVAEKVRAAIENSGFAVPAMLSFGEDVEANVARIAPASLRDAARTLASDADLEGIFLSCTNLRTLDIIADLETELGIPVLSSNQALAWHIGRLSNSRIVPNGPGRLMSL